MRQTVEIELLEDHLRDYTGSRGVLLA
jgi:hypothetical protein